MKTTLQLLVFVIALCAAAAAQVEPAATGPEIPVPPGNLTYAIRYGQTATFGGTVGNSQSSSLSGSFDYANGSERLPFSTAFSGGYDWTISGTNYGTGFFQNFNLSQGYIRHKFSASVDDSVGYFPQAPTIGFSGTPGTGEPVAGPGSGSTYIDQSILTINTHAVDNTASGQLNEILNSATIFNLSGSYNIVRYPDGNALDSNSAQANMGLQWRMDARNSLTGSYQYSKFSYPDLNFSFQTQAVLAGYTRSWNRQFTAFVSVGPQWTQTPNISNVPNTVGVEASAGLSYVSGHNSARASYSRAINNGGGFLVGARTDATTANLSRDIGRDTSIGLTASFNRTEQLTSNGITTAKYGGAEYTRRFGRYLLVYANYAAIQQNSSISLPINALGQLYQVIGFGIGYSPRHLRLSR